MKRTNIPLFSLCIAVTLFSCHKSDIPYTQDGDWVAMSELDGPNRSEAVGFTIGNYAYLGTGWDGLNKRYADFWQYDPAANVWSQVQSMPDSAARSSAVGFSVDGKGYVGTGYDGFNYLNDFWQFDPEANTWTRKADFPGSARYEAVGFGIDTYGGYLGTGFDGTNALKDFYKYDPNSDTWSYLGFSGNKRYGAAVFQYNNHAYVLTGTNSGSTVNDFWVFDPAAAKWSELRHITNYSDSNYDDAYTNIVRSNAAAFVIKGTTSGDKGYISTGENGALYTFTWEYDFASDLWKEKTPFEGPSTTGAVGLTVQNRGFVATGRTGSGQLAQSDKLWEFKPNDVVNPNNNY